MNHEYGADQIENTQHPKEDSKRFVAQGYRMPPVREPHGLELSGDFLGEGDHDSLGPQAPSTRQSFRGLPDGHEIRSGPAPKKCHATVTPRQLD